MTSINIDVFLACIASVSARARRESWDESKKRREMMGGGGGGRERPYFRAVTRLETLATQANVFPIEIVDVLSITIDRYRFC